MEKKRWRVRGGACRFRCRDGTIYFPGAVFEATEDEVADQRWKVDQIEDTEYPAPPPRRAKHVDRMVRSAPESTVIE